MLVTVEPLKGCLVTKESRCKWRQVTEVGEAGRVSGHGGSTHVSRGQLLTPAELLCGNRFSNYFRQSGNPDVYVKSLSILPTKSNV